MRNHLDSVEDREREDMEVGGNKTIVKRNKILFRDSFLFKYLISRNIYVTVFYFWEKPRYSNMRNKNLSHHTTVLV